MTTQQQQHQPLFGNYFIKTKMAGGSLYLDVQGRKAVQGAYCVLDDFHGGETQQWMIVGSRIQSAANPSLVLDVKGEKGPNVIIWPNNNQSNQQWVHIGDQIVTKLDNTRVLDVCGEKNKAGTYIYVWKNLNQVNQVCSILQNVNFFKKWELIPATQLLKKPEAAPAPAQCSKEVDAPLEPAMCLKCKGKGGIGDFGSFVDVTSPQCKEKCPTCNGERMTKRLRKCPGCNSLGGMGQYGAPCEISSIFFKNLCTQCEGRCYY